MKPDVARSRYPGCKVSEGRRAGCLKGGCFGLLGCAGLCVLSALVVLALRAAMGVPEARPSSERLERALPSLPPEREALGTPLPASAGRVVLAMGIGELEIEAGPPGEPIRVEADYDASQFELVDEFDPGSGDGWEYRVGLDRAVAWFRQRLDDEHIRVRIVLPRGVPFALEGQVGIGESRLELGGLWLTDVDLDFATGGHRVGFGEPLPEPLGRLRLRGKVGEMTVERVGNASPRECRITQRIGDVRVDLQGSWRQDSDVAVGLRLGGLEVALPREGVRVVTKAHGPFLGERDIPAPAGPPSAGPWTLRLSTANGIGEVRIRD